MCQKMLKMCQIILAKLVIIGYNQLVFCFAMKIDAYIEELCIELM